MIEFWQARQPQLWPHLLHAATPVTAFFSANSRQVLLLLTALDIMHLLDKSRMKISAYCTRVILSNFWMRFFKTDFRVRTSKAVSFELEPDATILYEPRFFIVQMMTISKTRSSLALGQISDPTASTHKYIINSLCTWLYAAMGNSPALSIMTLYGIGVLWHFIHVIKL